MSRYQVVKRLPRFERRALNLSQENIVTTAYPSEGTDLPLIAQPALEGVDLIAWARNNKEVIESRLYKHGAILFRDFNMAVDRFRQFITVICAELMEYNERSSPRSQVGGNIYTSTDYPAHLSIFPHNENSYADTWPLKIFFYCDTPALQGGETPIANSRKVFQRISPDIRERFIQKKVMYIRNFGPEFGLPWQTVFQTRDKEAVEEHCRRHAIEYEWKGGDLLRTRQVRSAVARHSRTGEMVWFNHAAFFHISTLEPGVRDLLLEEFEPEDLPNNTFYGDGSAIEDLALDEIRDAYKQETVVFPWRQGDILMLDNMLTSHGRAPFTGPRRILVAMAEPSSTDCL